MATGPEPKIVVVGSMHISLPVLVGILQNPINQTYHFDACVLCSFTFTISFCDRH